MSEAGIDLTGFWGGTYSYPSTHPAPPVSFDAELTQAGGRLSGSITEANSFVPGGPALLRAYVDGLVEGQLVLFAKTYDGDGAIHAIAYEGEAREDGTVVEGVWRVAGQAGRFLMRRDPGDWTALGRKADASAER